LIYTIQNTILKFHDFISSLNSGIYFLVSVAAIIFSSCVLYSILFGKSFGEKSKLEEILFVPALAVSLVFILDMILAGDIYPNLSGEKIARLFAESLCNGRIEEITDRKNKLISPDYHDKFTADWSQKYKELINIHCDADDFLLVEYHYEHLNISSPEKYMVVLRTSKIVNIPQKIDDITQCDYDFKISLIRVPIPSRFLGNYVRWRINSFSYKKSEPYTMKEWLDLIEKLIEKREKTKNQ